MAAQPQERKVRIALALPARDEAEAQAVALGALLGGYAFRRYRRESPPDASIILLAPASYADDAVRRAEVIADAVTLVRDLDQAEQLKTHVDVQANSFDYSLARQGYARAFVDFGLHVGQTSPEEAGERLRELAQQRGG